MDFGVDSFVAEFDWRGRPVALRAFAEAVDALRWRTDVRVALLLIDGASEVAAGDDTALLQIERARLPVVCAFEGLIAAGAASMVTACDVRICSDAASLHVAAVALPAQSALMQRLVSRSVPAPELVSTARSVARIIASRGPHATQLAKEAIRRGLPLPLEQALRFETDLTLLLQTTKDRAEGVRAFIEKRPPVFVQQ